MRSHTPSFPLRPNALERALEDGRGRALLHLRAGGECSSALLLRHFCHDSTYDPQCEGSRSVYLLDLAQHSHLDPELAVRHLCAALRKSTRTWDLQQQVELLGSYAAQGHTAAREALLWVVDARPYPDSPWLGDRELMALDGVSGATRCARSHLLRLDQGRGDPSDLEEWLRTAQERWDPLVLLQQLAQELPSAPLFEALRALAPDPDPTPAAPDPDLATVLAELNAGVRPLWRYSRWGRRASEEDLAQVFEAFCACTDPAKLPAFWPVFSRRPLPQITPELLERVIHCASPEARHGPLAFAMLAQNTHPLLRALALNLLQASPPDLRALGLLAHNFAPGDGALIAWLPRPRTRDGRHGLGLDLLNVFEAQPLPELVPALLRQWELSPCGQCRSQVLDHLIALEAAPDWLVDEAAWEAYPESRVTAHQKRCSASTIGPGCEA